MNEKIINKQCYVKYDIQSMSNIGALICEFALNNPFEYIIKECLYKEEITELYSSNKIDCYSIYYLTTIYAKFYNNLEDRNEKEKLIYKTNEKWVRLNNSIYKEIVMSKGLIIDKTCDYKIELTNNDFGFTVKYNCGFENFLVVNVKYFD